MPDNENTCIAETISNPTNLSTSDEKSKSIIGDMAAEAVAAFTTSAPILGLSAPPRHPIDLSPLLSKPLHCATLSLGAAGTTVSYDTNGLLLLTPISQLVNRFYSIRATVCVRVECAFSPVTYGLAYAALVTNSALNQVSQVGNGDFTPGNQGVYTNNPGRLVTCTPGAFIDLNRPDPLVLKYPWRYPTDSMPIQPGLSFNAFPQLVIAMFQSLARSDGAAVPDANVTVYGWLEDVELYNPTTFASASEHFVEGPLAAAATTVSKVAKALTNTPLRPLADPVHAGAKAAAAAFTSLGWSRPLVAQPATTMLKRTVPNLANGIGLESANILSVDPLCGVLPVSTDTDVKEDLLTVQAIARRWGWVGNASWSTASAANTDLFVVPVSPMLADSVGAANAPYQPTPVMFASQFFDYWGGTLEFRVKISATPFIRGKLLVYLSPGSNAAAGSLIAAQYNNASCVLDVTKDLDAVFRVGNAGAYNIQSTWPAVGAPGTQPYSIGSSANFYGNLCCKVLDPLVAQAAPVVVTLSVFVRAGPDFFVSSPGSTWTTCLTAVSDNTKDANGKGYTQGRAATAFAPEIDPPLFCTLGETVSPRAIERFSGERVDSLRLLMKRTAPCLVLQGSGSLTSINDTHIDITTLPRLPMMKRSNAPVKPGFITGYCDILPNVFGLLLMAFEGSRGSVTHRVFRFGTRDKAGATGAYGGTALVAPSTGPTASCTVATRMAIPPRTWVPGGTVITAQYYPVTAAAVATRTANPIPSALLPLVMGGDVRSDAGEGLPVAEVVLPYQCDVSYLYPGTAYVHGGAEPTNYNGLQLVTFYSGQAFPGFFVQCVCAGEDFDVVGWMGPPQQCTGTIFQTLAATAYP